MKKGLTYGLSVALLGLLGYLSLGIIRNVEERKDRSAKLRTLPDISRMINRSARTATDSVYGASDSLLRGRPSLIILFHPDCDHCQYEARELLKHTEAFAHARLWLLSHDRPERVRAFARQYGLDRLPNAHVGAVSGEELFKAFGPTSVPHLFVYGPDGQLRKEFKGETRIDAVLKYL